LFCFVFSFSTGSVHETRKILDRAQSKMCVLCMIARERCERIHM